MKRKERRGKMFWLGFGIGVYTAIIIEFIALIVYAIKGRGKK